MAAQSFKDLRVWQESMALALDVYRICCYFPRDERFGLSAQLKRAAVSIPSNIAEGSRRRRRAPFAFHLEVALGSQAEVEVQLELAHCLGFIAESDYEPLRQRVETLGRMLNRLIDHHRVRTTHYSPLTTNEAPPE
jgi:four helix bundle protein